MASSSSRTYSAQEVIDLLQECELMDEEIENDMTAMDQDAESEDEDRPQSDGSNMNGTVALVPSEYLASNVADIMFQGIKCSSIKILLPYVQQKRKYLSLKPDHSALVIFDRFRGQCTEKILGLLQHHHVLIAIVPANCTDRLQPLDVSVNKSAKEYLRRQFQSWYSDQVCHNILQNKE